MDAMASFLQQAAHLVAGFLLVFAPHTAALPSAAKQTAIINAPNTTGADNTYCLPGNVANFGNSDGPALLPQTCLYTALAATPSPGKIIAVPAGGSLVNAIASSSCGDTITLQA